ncbi:MAG: hypothetical protein ILP19_09295 [Oscillospiraceae bacterium]|nr:hypothetical protein [Oscillospiraceae bacterium]
MNGGYTEIINEIDHIARDIASFSEILFRLSQADPADEICRQLGLAAAALSTENIPDIDGIGRVLYIKAVRERMETVAEEVESFCKNTESSLTKLYMHRELLVTLRDGSSKGSDALSGYKAMLSDMCGKTASQSEKALISHSIKDALLSQTVAQKNISLAESWLIKTDDLISGLTSFETHMIPLWKSGYTGAAMSYSSDDIRGCFETGNLFAEKISEIIRKAGG